MGTVGEILKKSREEQGHSLTTVSDETKIGIYFLEAMEKNDFMVLPKGCFPKKFIQAYARFLAIDENEIVQLYYEQIAQVEAEMEEVLPPPPAQPVATRYGFLLPGIVFICILLVLILVAILFFRSGASPAIPSPQPAVLSSQQPTPSNISQNTPNIMGSQPSKPTLPSSPTIAPGTTNPPPSPSPTLTDPNKVVISLQSNSDCWISIISNTAQLAFLLRPGESFSRAFTGEVTMRIGNAGGVSMMLNQQAASPLGAVGEVRTITLSPENYKQYLATKPEASH